MPPLLSSSSAPRLERAWPSPDEPSGCGRRFIHPSAAHANGPLCDGSRSPKANEILSQAAGSSKTPRSPWVKRRPLNFDLGTAVPAIGLILPKSCSRAVVMVQPAEQCYRDDLARMRADHAPCWDRDPLTKPVLATSSSGFGPLLSTEFCRPVRRPVTGSAQLREPLSARLALTTAGGFRGRPGRLGSSEQSRGGCAW